MATKAAQKLKKTDLLANMDALSLLKSDHEKVTHLFEKFEKMKDGESAQEKMATVKEICSELTVHATIEEQIFYPAVRKVIQDDDLMDEAKVEHAGAKNLLHEIENMNPEDDLLNAKVKVLSEYIKHHVKEEQEEMFPKVRKAKIDLEGLGSKMVMLKKSLMSKGGMQL